MSKYTTEVRYICEFYAGRTESGDYDEIDDIISDSADTVIGNYPIFDENYREVLNAKILKHYYTREICEETVGLWKLRLNARMNEIMPYYNKLYESELLQFNPFYDVDLHTDHTGSENKTEDTSATSNDSRNETKAYTNNTERLGTETTENNTASSNAGTTVSNGESESSGNNSNNATSKSSSTATASDTKNTVDKFSETPQGGITGLADDTYLTNARMVENNDSNSQNGTQQAESNGSANYSESGTTTDVSSVTGTEKSESHGSASTSDRTTNNATEQTSTKSAGDRNENKNINSTDSYLEHVYGKRGGASYAKLLQEYRDTFLNIDMMIITNLSDLFFGLWE